MNYRHEFKHEINYSDMLALSARLSAVMRTDSHALNGEYTVRSLYFDNLDDKALLEKLDGVNMREKFRLRCYNNDFSYILLEKKIKINGLCEKLQQEITADDAGKLIDGDALFCRNDESLVHELCAKMNTQGLRAKTLVEYTRKPFVFPAGNVRVTLDYNLRTGMGRTDFLNPDCLTLPARDAPAILEVKWDEFLPDVIKKIIFLPGKHTSAFSKYAAARY